MLSTKDDGLEVHSIRDSVVTDIVGAESLLSTFQTRFHIVGGAPHCSAAGTAEEAPQNRQHQVLHPILGV